MTPADTERHGDQLAVLNLESIELVEEVGRPPSGSAVVVGGSGRPLTAEHRNSGMRAVFVVGDVYAACPTQKGPTA